jgi:SynChlorMet cassette protein ScmA
MNTNYERPKLISMGDVARGQAVACSNGSNAAGNCSNGGTPGTNVCFTGTQGASPDLAQPT